LEDGAAAVVLVLSVDRHRSSYSLDGNHSIHAHQTRFHGHYSPLRPFFSHPEGRFAWTAQILASRAPVLLRRPLFWRFRRPSCLDGHFFGSLASRLSSTAAVLAFSPSVLLPKAPSFFRGGRPGAGFLICQMQCAYQPMRLDHFYRVYQ